MNKVSVIIPTFNRANTIIDSVKSVLTQTYQNIEVIIVDDGSIDNTINLLKNMNCNKITILQNDQNMGACFSRNRGIKYATGDYIAFQDSDDIWLPNKVEECLQYLKSTNSDFVFHQVICENVKGKPITPQIDFNSIDDKLLYALTKGGVNTQTMFAKASCFKDTLFDEEMPRSQDWELMIRIVQKYKVYFIKKPLVKYIMLDDSISKSSEKGLKALELIKNKHFSKYYDIYKDELDYSYNYHKGELYALDNNYKESINYYKLAYKIKKSNFLLIKIILMKIHLYSFVRKIFR